MDPQRDDPPPSTAILPPAQVTTSQRDDSLLSEDLNRLSLESAAAVPLPKSPSGSLFSPAKASSRPGTSQQTAPRRIPSSGSLKDERRKSSAGLQARSPTASRSTANADSVSPSMARSSSSNLATSPTIFSGRSSLSAASDTQAPTAASIAAAHFQKEVDLHQTVDLQSETMVIVHDACYGHRFSRPRTTKAALNTIVERPERIRAGVVGVSAAYVRLGLRHAGERFAPHPNLDLHMLPAPPFQVRRTGRTMALSSPAVTHVHGTKWMDDLKDMCNAAESRLALNGRELVRPHGIGNDPGAPALHEGDLYLCSESLNAFEGALGGVCDGVDAVFSPSSTKRAFVCIRPPGHHCSSGHPSGFCWLNNVHVGISYAAMTHGLTHAAVLDFDLHHGDGSQDIAWQQNSRAVAAAKNSASYKKTMIGYYSLHDINSYPCEMGDMDKVRNASVCVDKAHGQSIWNVHLEEWKTSAEFWNLYATKYALLIDKARNFLRHHTQRLANTPNAPHPKGAVFISAGFDASEWEGAGMQRHKANVPTDFYAKFTSDVVQMANEEGLGVDGRVISVLEGGYSDRALTSGIFSHLSGLGHTQTSMNGQSVNRLASEMTDRLGLHQEPNVQEHTAKFNAEWWSPNFLEELEALVQPPPAPMAKAQKSTYSAPTRSSSAKVVATSRERTPSATGDFDTTAPLPEVGWATAAHELSKVIIPSYRQTVSCRPDELNAEASRLRRERQTAADGLGISANPEDNRMKLRVRKPKSSLPGTPKMETPKRQVIKGNRRTTIDPTGDLADQIRSEREKSTTGSDEEQEGQTTPTRISVPTTRRTPSRQTAASARSSSAGSARKKSPTRNATPKRSASPRKAPPVPKVPSGMLRTASGEGPADKKDTRVPSQPNDDMDRLSAGVRKLNLKLKVPSPEENAAREKAKQQKESAKIKSPRSPKKGPAKGARTTRPPSASTSSSKSVPTTPVPRTAAVKNENQGFMANTGTMPSQGKMPVDTPPIYQGDWGNHPMRTGFETDNKFTHAAFPSQQHNLPVFTSTSAIPFAPAASADAQNQATHGHAPNTHDIYDTARNTSHFPTNSGHSGAHHE